MTTAIRRQGTAVVIGGSLAGLLAARVVADVFEHVSIVERGSLDVGPDARSDIPQASQTHVLLLRGRQALEQLLPDLETEVLAAGAPLYDNGLGSLTFGRYGWIPRHQTGLETFAASRHLLDVLVRRRVLALPNVEARSGYEVTGLLTDQRAARGVRLRRRVAGAEEEELHADFVVDAGGRSSRMPVWLAEAGFSRPRTTVIDAHVGYATRWYRIPDELDLGWNTLTIQSLSPEIPRAGVAVRMENGKLAVTLMGAAGEYPPTDEAAFLEFARALRSTRLHETIDDLEPLTPVYGYRRNENRLVHYNRVPRFPEQLVVLGDAACGFNPTYGQGMTVAALGAEILQRTLCDQRDRFPNGDLKTLGRRFQRRLARAIVPAWDLATGEDSRYPTTEGARHPWVNRVIDPYMDRLLRAMMVRPDATRTFLEVITMVKPPSVLFEPRFVLSVLRQPLDGIAPIMYEDGRDTAMATRRDVPQHVA